jgi:hypothetical protein
VSSSPLVGARDTLALTATLQGTMCSICLEPLGHNPVVSLPCFHRFDLACFLKVEEGICPLCRFNVSESRVSCSECEVAGDLWLCLVCGVVCCGRYGGQHAHGHFGRNPTHRYYIQVGGLRVWDMALDTFVHRLIATSDGRFQQAPRHHAQRGDSGDDQDDSFEAGPSGAGMFPPIDWATLGDTSDDDDDFGGSSRPTGGQGDAVHQSKFDTIAEYYSELLQQMLTAQHQHFVAAIDSERDHARLMLFSREMEGRSAIVAEAAKSIGAVVSSSLDELANIARGAKRAYAAACERRSSARTTVEALRRNVAKLEEMSVKGRGSVSPSPEGASPGAAGGDAGAKDAEIQQLEAKLAAIYGQFT